MQRKDILEILIPCKKAINKSIAYLRECNKILNEPFLVGYKSRDNIITTFDTTAQKIILDTLVEKCDISFIFYSEELDKPKTYGNPEIKITTDPLDQTSSFMYGNLEFASSSILVLDLENNPLCAVVGDVSSNKLYYADKTGAKHGNKKLHPSTKVGLLEARIAVYADKISRKHLYDKTIFPLMKCGARVVNNGGSLFACRVADGRFHAALEPKPVGLYEFAGAYIAEMAGCVVTDIKGNKIDYNPERKNTYIAASNLGIHREVLKMIRIRK